MRFSNVHIGVIPGKCCDPEASAGMGNSVLAEDCMDEVELVSPMHADKPTAIRVARISVRIDVWGRIIGPLLRVG